MAERQKYKTRATYNVPGHAHELTFSVYLKKRKMFEPGVVEAYLESLVTISAKYKFDIWAYVVMPDHCHVLVFPTGEVYSMENFKRDFKSKSSKAIFALHPEWRKYMKTFRPSRGVEARFWQQGGGYDRNFFTAKATWKSINYLHNNPVRKGFVDAPSDWAWSSARNYEGLRGEIPITICPWEY